MVPRQAKVVRQFHPELGRWSEIPFGQDSRNLIAGFVRRHTSIFMAPHAAWRDGWLQHQPQDAVPYPLDQGDSIGSEALLYLVDDMPILDPPCMLQHRLLMEDGKVYDFRTTEFSQARREDYFRRYTPWTFEEPSWMGTAAAEFVLGKGGALELLRELRGLASIVDASQDALSGWAPQARRLLNLMEKLRAVDPFLDWLLDFAPDFDSGLYLLLFLARGLSAHPEYTECLFLVGAAQSGKDVLIKMLQKLAGTGPNHLLAAMRWGYLTEKSRGSSEGCSPFLRAAAAARFLIFSPAGLSLGKICA